MAVTRNPNSTPGEVQSGEDVPSNLDAARPVVDRIKDAQLADASATSGGDTVIDNTPETAAANARAEEEAKAQEAEAAKEETKATARKRSTETK